MDGEKKAFYDLSEIKAVPLQEICAELGISVKEKGNSAWFSIRPEKEPSCKIYPGNTYCDFGDSGRGGSGIDLVAAVEAISPEEAITWIGEHFGLRPTNGVSGQRVWELSDRQYAMIGIQADLATKNFRFNFDDYDEEQNRAFAEKYRIPVQQLAKEYPKVYHNMLRKVALPHLQRVRNEYYNELFWKVRYAEKEPTLAQYIYDDISLENLRKKAEKCEEILRRAITDSNLLRFQWRTYNISRDAEKMRKGELSFELSVGAPLYAELKEAAAKAGEKLKYCEISFEDFWKDDVYEKFLSGTATVVFCKGEMVNLAYRPAVQPNIDALKDFYCFRQEAAQGLKRN